MVILDENELIFRELCRKALKKSRKIVKVAKRRIERLKMKGYAYKMRYSIFLNPRGDGLVIEVSPTQWHFYKEKLKMKAKD